MSEPLGYYLPAACRIAEIGGIPVEGRRLGDILTDCKARCGSCQVKDCAPCRVRQLRREMERIIYS